MCAGLVKGCLPKVIMGYLSSWQPWQSVHLGFCLSVPEAEFMAWDGRGIDTGLVMNTKYSYS